MKRIVLLLLVLVAHTILYAQVPTWGKQVSCIIYSHCTSCHNPEGLAGSSLLTYDDAFNSRFGILNKVVSGQMPPYLPDVTYNHLAGERVLTDEEKNTLINWVNAGAPAGDTSNALPKPVYNTTQVITNPDLTARIPSFTIPFTGGDLYQAFVITNPGTTDRYISQIEVLPGNKNVVHHVLVFQDTAYKVVANDSAQPGPGYVSFGGVGSPTAKLVATWVPGSSVYTLPAGMGIKLSAGSRIILQIHYPDGAGGQMDSTRVNMRFTPVAVRNVSIAPILNANNLTNGPLFIPANTVKTFYSKFTVPSNVSTISIGPHAHLLCKQFEVYGVTPANDTLRLIKINDWDFHWQGSHSFQRPVKLPAGTILHGIATYDNTANNPDNPNSPPQDVSQGEATTDEMMLIYFAYLPYQSGDENIIIDTASHMGHYLNCVPEPLILPVRFTSFTAMAYQRSVLLNWSTAQEPGCKYYAVERSTDGTRFTALGNVSAAANGEATHQYTFTDASPADGLNYYRLKQVDNDGKYTYTPIRSVRVGANGAITVFPNPARRQQALIIDWQSNEGKAIEMINPSGQVVYSSSGDVTGITNISLPAHLPPGPYFLRLHTLTSVETRKIMVE